MKAVTVVPKQPGSAELTDIPEPDPSEGPLLVEAVAIGVDGTDQEIIDGAYGWPPAGRDRLVLGHESLGHVLEAPDEAGFAAGDLVVGIVRHPDPVPCINCAVGEWDMCRNGRYTEHGIKERDGFIRERYRLVPEMTVKVDPGLDRLAVLTEPTSVVAKAWDHVERIGSRARFEPERALVTGAGPIGLLAAMIGVQKGLDVHVLDRVTEGPKPALVQDLGATYHSDLEEAQDPFDVVVECTGVGQLVFHAIEHLAGGGIMALTGIASSDRQIPLDTSALNKEMVLNNSVVFGSVNANRRHFEQAARALAAADRDWLARIITRWEPLDDWKAALERRPDDVKTAILLGT
ncbi:MAG TPA: glucose 1-dehydrogenase [Actinomycetota bacterium]|jgi:threonine dehydrogenase-like Zn-dependent dehydrogenase|nr:glucose 1-dehydrogenase [Actinomycetota bacterium]